MLFFSNRHVNSSQESGAPSGLSGDLSPGTSSVLLVCLLSRNCCTVWSD